MVPRSSHRRRNLSGLEAVRLGEVFPAHYLTMIEDLAASSGRTAGAVIRDAVYHLASHHERDYPAYPDDRVFHLEEMPEESLKELSWLKEPPQAKSSNKRTKGPHPNSR